MPPKSVNGHGEILVFSGLAAIFAGLELGGVLYLQRFAAKRSVSRRIMGSANMLLLPLPLLSCR
jgi:hypothetical protein